jgi:hypothetical protein
MAVDGDRTRRGKQWAGREAPGIAEEVIGGVSVVCFLLMLIADIAENEKE